MKKMLKVFIGLAVIVTVYMIGVVQVVSAAELTSRSLLIANSQPSASTSHTFNFTLPDSTTVGSITFQYCVNPLVQVSCVSPTGLDVSGVSLVSQSGETGFSILSRTVNQITLTRIPAATSAEPVSYSFSGAINPSTLGSFSVRIFTYPTSNASGSYTDNGSVVNSTTQAITLSSSVPEVLDFCVGRSIPGNCSTASGNFVQLGSLHSLSTSSATSQLLGGTNGQHGLSITVNGSTMTSGNNQITPLGSPSFSLVGNDQFGFNLRSNNSPNVGSDPAGSGNVTPTANYNIPNRFTFNNGDVIASTATPTDPTILTASYIVNVASGQAVGVYDTTLTFICAASF